MAEEKPIIPKVKLTREVKIGLFVAVVLFVLGILFWVYTFFMRTPYYPSSRVLVTSSHIGSIVGYEKVYSDDDSDYAIFVREAYSANQLRPEDQVKIGNHVGYVLESHDTYFSISIIAPDTMPGTPVYYNGAKVGFVSYVNGQTATCTYY